MKNTIALVLLGGLLYTPQAHTLSDTSAGVLSAMSVAAAFGGHCRLQDAFSECCFDAGLDIFAYAVNWSVAALAVHLFYSYTPKGRLLHAQDIARQARQDPFIQRAFSDNNSVYDFINQEFSQYNWPLLAAKRSCAVLSNKIEKEIGSLEAAIGTAPVHDSVLRKELHAVLNELQRYKKYCGIIMGIINEHPNYCQMQQAVSEIDALRDVANAQRFQTHFVWNV